jgi:hypothetical protein
MKRRDEELCKSVFDRHLLSLVDRGDVHWTDVERKDEPPDFYVEVAGTRYAVEVTSLVERLPSPSQRKRSFLDVLFPLKEMVERLAASAKRSGHLNGAYVVVFGYPFDDLASIRGKLETGLLSYLQTTQASMSAPEQVIYRQGNQQCAITKIHHRAVEVRMLWNVGVVNADGIAADICCRFTEILERKVNLLRAISLPKILLLRDLYAFGQYGLGNADIRQLCTNSRTGALSAFHAVFVIQDDRTGFALYPEEFRWSKSLFVRAPA